MDVKKYAFAKIIEITHIIKWCFVPLALSLHWMDKWPLTAPFGLAHFYEMILKVKRHRLISQAFLGYKIPQ
jgi:hypothetical protein